MVKLREQGSGQAPLPLLRVKHTCLVRHPFHCNSLGFTSLALTISTMAAYIFGSD